jgi:hypothetical protein
MPDEIVAGQDAPVVIDQATNTEAAQTNAATTDAGTGAAEGGEHSQAAQPRSFTQAELDAIVTREKSKAEAKAERRVLRTLERVIPSTQQQPQQQQPRNEQAGPTRAQYASDEDYLDAKLEWKLAQREQATAKDREREEAQKLAKTTDKLYAEAQKQPGFDREAFDELPLTKPMVEALVDSDQAPQLMAYMAAHPEEIARIAELRAGRQAAELGKLEAKLAATPPVRTSKAPDPITPVGSGKTPVHNLASAPVGDYIEMRKKQGAAWAR